MAVDRMKFLQIGGFDILYYPAYVEDVDLCFQAWRKGWSCIFEPSSKVLHREGGSWKSVKDSSLDAKLLRNSLLFQWLYLPTNQDKWHRRWSVLKISLGELLRFKCNWLFTYYFSLFEILILRKKTFLSQLEHDELQILGSKMESAKIS